MKNTLLAMLICLFSLTGCASLSQEECQTGDWHGIGYRDGLQGKRESYLAEHQQACSEYQVSLNLEQYLEGREKGLYSYCKPENATRLGRSGASYHYVCPKKTEAKFLSHYQAGREYYLQQQKVRSIEREIAQYHRQVKEVTKKITQKEVRLVSEGMSTSERQQLLKEIRALESELPLDNAHLEQLQIHLYQEQTRLRSLN